MLTPFDRDSIYAEPLGHVDRFVFDEKVAAVFPDMLNRSIPGYATILRMIGLLAGRCVPRQGRCYDLGCSLGAAALVMARAVADRSAEIIAVDNSAAMIERAKGLLEPEPCAAPITFHCGDIIDFPMENAAMVVLNFTLQFVDLQQREAVLRRVHDALIPGGILVLSEKVAFSDSGFQQWFSDMHHQFKMDQGYSELEISQKRSALEKVLVPETPESHRLRLEGIGFTRQTCWFQCLNFMSLLAVK
jgi:tRNA (cmo5U34)-methyltransferase